MAQMTPTQLMQVLEQEIANSENYAAEAIREDQLKNLQYYLGLPLGNEVPGRSQVQSWDVFEIIESAMPGFIEPFFSSDRIGEFKSRTPEDDAFVEQATDFANYIIKDRNDGFLIFNTWIKDALLSKVGVVRADWEESEPKRREWQGLSDEQLTMIAQDERIEIVGHTARPLLGMPMMNEAQAIQAPPPMVHDVTIHEKQAGCVKIVNIRPENFIVSRGVGLARDARVIGEWVVYTRSELKGMGIRQYMDVQSYDVAVAAIGGQQLQTIRDDTGSNVLNEGTADDPSIEEVKLFKGFVRADYDKDGIAEWRRVLVGAGDDPFLENEDAEGHNYCILSPIPIPHRIIGMAYADPARQIQDVKTVLTRQYLDSLYLANRPRLYVNTDAGVSIEDLLSDRIGGIIRGRGPANTAISPIQTAAVSRDALEGIQLADGMRETRLGIPKINPGLEADALHKTATGTRSINAAVDKRQKMTLRLMAETGIKDLFRLVLRLVTKYQDVAASVQLRGEWVHFDPRQWNADLDCVVAVGVGTSDEAETMALLQQFAQYMQWAQSVGAVTPLNVYEFGKLLAKNARLKGADTKLLTDPQKNPPQQQPNPAQMQMQVEQMKEQGRQQTEAAKMQMQRELEQFKSQMQAEVDANRQRQEAQQQESRIQAEMQLAQFKAELDANTRERLEMIKCASAERIAKINAEAKLVGDQIAGQTVLSQQQEEAADMAVEDSDDAEMQSGAVE